MNDDYVIINGELYHYGVKGMRWGHRKFQNEDGSLTPKGQKRLTDNMSIERTTPKISTKMANDVRKAYNSVLSDDERKQLSLSYKKCQNIMKEYEATGDKAKKAKLEKDYLLAVKEHEELAKKATNKIIGKYSNDNAERSRAAKRIDTFLAYDHNTYDPSDKKKKK